MTKQTITTEIDIPDGFEFVRIGLLEKRDWYITVDTYTQWNHDSKPSGTYIIIRPIWQPPSWMRPGWISSCSVGDWYWCELEPREMSHCFLSVGNLSLCIYQRGKPTVGDFTPPPCDDWRTSKRRIGGKP